MDEPRKTKLEKRIFAGLLVIFAVGLVSLLKNFWPSSASRPMPRPPSSLSHREEVTARLQATDEYPSSHESSGSMEGPSGRTRIQYTAEEFRDPLVSLLPKPNTDSQGGSGSAEVRPAAPPVAPSVKVEGMLWGSPHPQVLIDGQLYGVGDTVQGSQIVAITREGVAVVNQGVRFVLRPPTVADDSTSGMFEHGR